MSEPAGHSVPSGSGSTPPLKSILKKSSSLFGEDDAFRSLPCAFTDAEFEAMANTFCMACDTCAAPIKMPNGAPQVNSVTAFLYRSCLHIICKDCTPVEHHKSNIKMCSYCKVASIESHEINQNINNAKLLRHFIPLPRVCDELTETITFQMEQFKLEKQHKSNCEKCFEELTNKIRQNKRIHQEVANFDGTINELRSEYRSQHM